MTRVPRIIPHYTIEDYRHWDGDWELIDGVPIAMSPSPFGPHERIVSRLSFQLQSQIRQNDCRAEVYTNLDWIVSNDTVIRPDVMVICGDQPQRHQESPPALVVEVLSDSTRRTDLIAKRSIVQENRVGHYFVIDRDPNEVHHLTADGESRPSMDATMQIRLGDQCEIELTFGGLFV